MTCTQHFILDRLFTHNTNALITIVGRPGSGKSYAAARYSQSLTDLANREYRKYFVCARCGNLRKKCKCAKFTTRKKTWAIDKNLMFRPREFFSKVRLRSEGGELEHGDVILCDEWHLSAPNREFMSLINRRAVDVVSTFRVDRFAVIFTLPIFTMQDSTIGKLMTAYVNMIDQGLGKFYYLETDYYTGKQYRKFREEYVPGFGMVEFREVEFRLPTKGFIEEYEMHKRTLVTEVKDRGLEAADISEGRMKGRVRAEEVLNLLTAGAFPAVTDGGDLTSRQRLGILTVDLQRMFKYRSVGLGEIRAAFDAWEGGHRGEGG